MQDSSLYFQKFQRNVSGWDIPERFTYPFYYEPHALALVAAAELQSFLESQSDWNHNFGLNPRQEGLVIGKMFGVLVVQTQGGELGYLAAFSGKLAESNHQSFFVPPVFDMLAQDGFYKAGENELNQYNRSIEALEGSQERQQISERLAQIDAQATIDINRQKDLIRAGKIDRDRQRTEAKANLSPSAYESLSQQLAQESLQVRIVLKQMTQHYEHLRLAAQTELEIYDEEIASLKLQRKVQSAALQQKLFEHYSFLNSAGTRKSIAAIFDGNPPAGAGECAAPKLLQFAFQSNLKPIAFAEFWWGQSPKSEIRKHRQFYPACQGKCAPILGHMLEGMAIDDNPLAINPAAGKDLPILYEDDYITIVNKPAEFLSVPGKTISDSVYERARIWYPEATGPLVVHRLDMSTSGILLIAKTKEVYVALQAQFIKRTIKKKYVALLEGTLSETNGTINLPLRLDIDNRPHQVVCDVHGKPAETRWELIETRGNQTLVHFFPVTGRTHQLRVHAAHPLGLNAPIVGDDLYGAKADRLHLHAAELTFFHPIARKAMTISVSAAF